MLNSEKLAAKEIRRIRKKMIHEMKNYKCWGNRKNKNTHKKGRGV
jgi:hypothetical protein